MAGIKSVQRGTITFQTGNGIGDATINDVDITKSIVLHQGYTQESGSGIEERVRLLLPDSNTVRAFRTISNFANTVGYTVLEFN